MVLGYIVAAQFLRFEARILFLAKPAPAASVVTRNATGDGQTSPPGIDEMSRPI
jgi:hypothetical protein